MPKILVEDGNLDLALKKFKRVADETKRNYQRHEYYLRPGLRLKEKALLSAKKRHKQHRA
ncbi:30S ribosomal protein S21 [bacterium]|nr:30S ribosomal protein S21 [bacterium]MBQ5492564.1 30S ribosomal protein S21 [Mycoplasmataceae bacterium]MBO6023006.1 30S ribosomal protein S21 [bacterium]MBO6041897.1 30S ribosomal protein S21 [bacterium]MBO6072639.1 30S ribosomal protein S21 [bacterium]